MALGSNSSSNKSGNISVIPTISSTTKAGKTSTPLDINMPKPV